jgi:hypothetical protein
VNDVVFTAYGVCYTVVIVGDMYCLAHVVLTISKFVVDHECSHDT